MFVYAPSLATAVMKLFPGTQPGIDFAVNEEDGIQNIYIWNINAPQPSRDELMQAAIDEALNEAKEAKKQELNEICNQEITKGFLYTVNGIEYRFSYDMEAQMNFAEARAAVNDGLITEVEWTCYVSSTGERVRIMLNATSLSDMRVAQLTQKNAVISKYNDILLNQVYPATDVATIEAVKWV